MFISIFKKPLTLMTNLLFPTLLSPLSSDLPHILVAPAPHVFGKLIMMLFGLLIPILIFLALRQVAIWYFKIDKIVQNQSYTNHLLDVNNQLLKQQIDLLSAQNAAANSQNGAEAPRLGTPGDS